MTFSLLNSPRINWTGRTLPSRYTPDEWRVRKPALRLILNRCRSTGFLSHTTLELLGVRGRDLTPQEKKLAAEIDTLRSAIFVHATVARDGRGACFATMVDEHGLLAR